MNNKTITLTLIATAIISIALGVVATQHFMVYPEPTETITEVVADEDYATIIENTLDAIEDAEVESKRKFYLDNPYEYEKDIESLAVRIAIDWDFAISMEQAKALAKTKLNSRGYILTNL